MTQPEGGKSQGSLMALFRSRLLRVAVSLFLLGLILYKVDLAELASALHDVKPGYFLGAIMFFLVASATGVYKWRLILRAQGVQASFFYLFSLFFIGFFFSNFLPTNFGGDVVKIFKLSRKTGRSVEAASSVVIDRVSSTFALLLIAIIPAFIELRLLGPKLTALIIAMFVLLLLFIALLVHEGTARRIAGLPLLRRDVMDLRRHVIDFYYAIHEFKHRRGVVAAMLVISLAYQALQVIAVYFLALSLGIELSVVYYFIFIPILQAVSMIPISFNGLGVREGAWVLLFSQAGITAEEAFSMSILSLIVMTLMSLLGGIFYLFDRATPAPQGETDHGKP